MGDMWRSQKMQLVQMIVQNDAAHGVVNKLGQQGLVEFRDLNAGTSFYKRSFVDEVRKCDDLSRVLRGVGAELESTSIVVGGRSEALAISQTLDELEPRIREVDEELATLKASQELLLKNHNALIEQKLVLQLGKHIYAKQSTAGGMAPTSDEAATELMALSEFSSAPSSLLGQVSGVVKREQRAALERVIFRATRGNAVFETEPIETQLLDVDSKGATEPVEKDFFMILFAGEFMRDKIAKICSYFGASLYKFPESVGDLGPMSAEVERRISESSEVLARGEQVMHTMLLDVAASFATWNFVISREKMVYDTLNMCEFDIKRHVFVAEGWVPANKYDAVMAALQEAQTSLGLPTRPILNRLTTSLTPPTYIPVTKFTSGFQALVNTYGTPRYREANPGAFACIMFPFLFGIMFGDFGHGLLLAGFGYFLISKEKEWEGKTLNDMVAMCFGGRYIILLNGIFGAYVGLMYNEAFAFPMNFFGGSRWYTGEHEPCELGEGGEIPICMKDENYPVGIDPIWHYTGNKISFFNSFKMKISIIVGVLQMTVGICLSLTNHLEYKDYKKVFFQYIPEIVFFEGIFGYLVFTIFYKWSIDWNGDVGVPGNPGPQPAPSLLTLLINMFMSPGSDIDVPLYGASCFTDCAIGSIAAACGVSCGGEGPDQLAPLPNEYKVCFSESQNAIQFWLLIAAFVAVPFLLFPIPFIELAHHNAAKAKAASYENLVEEKNGQGGHEEDEDDGFSFGDAFIHQAIHTIEFVLGSISNTASYLRLWALSLAHSQLAELFKDMILIAQLKLGLGSIGDGAVTFFAFGTWAVISMVVLMVMENLSSFLHALRLQWVEFQNKFFYGDGQKYTAFSFAILDAVGDDE